MLTCEDPENLSAPCFDFSSLLLETIMLEEDAGEDASVPTSPVMSPFQHLEKTLTAALEDLSPLTSPDFSPPASPKIASRSVPSPDAGTKSGSNRRARLQAAKHRRRAQKRDRDRAATDAHSQARHNLKLKYVDSAETVFCDVRIEDEPVARTGYVALDDCTKTQKVYSLDELIEEGSKFKMTLYRWDGRKTVRFVDTNGRVFMVLAGQPEDDDWEELCQQGADALESQRSSCRFPNKVLVHRRGAFPSLRCGVSYGRGQKAPSNLTDNRANKKVLASLNSMPTFKRLAGFSSSVMVTWAPDLHRYYSEMIDRVHKDQPLLRRIFPSSVFSAASYNFGPRTACFPHKDVANLPFGWCALTALGSFNAAKGGHLVLWNARMVIEFPSASSILFPSAVIPHSNVGVAKDERRYSFAQYTAGGLFRWADQNLQGQKSYLDSLSPEELEDNAQQNLARWSYGLSLLPTVARPNAE